MAIAKTKVAGANAIGNVQNVLKITGMDADITLTSQEAADVGIIDVTATAAKAIILPAVIEGKVIIVKNSTAATHAVTVKVGASGTGVAVAATKTAILRCGATDIERVTADA
jgi:hypothetical protein